MEVLGPESDWRSPAFRQKVVAHLEDAMRKAGTAHTKSSTDMENSAFVKANTREDYLSLVARLINHFRDIHKKAQGGPDPMNALQNLTGVGGGGPGFTGIGPRPPGAPMSGMGTMGQMQMGQLSMQGVARGQQAGTAGQMQMMQQQQQSIQFQQFQTQQQQASMQPQQQTTMQQNPMQQQLNQQVQQMKLQQHLQQQPHQYQQLQHQNLQQQHTQNQQQQQQQNQLHQNRLQQQQLAQLQQQLQQQQQQQALAQSLAQMTQGQHQQMNSLSQQQQQLKIQAIQQARALQQQLQQQQQQQQQQVLQVHQAAQLSGVPGQMMPRPGIQIPPRLPRATLNSAIPQNSVAMGGQQMPQGQQMMSSPSPVQVKTPQSMPPPPQPQPSPQPPSSQPTSVSSGPTHSPGGFQPSTSPQPSHSPASSCTPQSYPLQVPSPGPLNTPENLSSVMSPAGTSQSEDQQYMDKLKQLSKYIEPLRRMINKIDKNEDRKKYLSKMKSLLNILTDPNTRCPLRTLQKCEIALEKLKNDMAVPTPPTPPPPPVQCTKKQYLCQPLLDAAMANIRSPVFNHSLYRTFAPAMTTVHGPPITGPSVPSRKRKFDDDDERQTIPNILQGEVARLNSRFLVNLDPSFCSNNGTVHLICKLDDTNLPSVPPLQLSIPADYPDQSPHWEDVGQQYEANQFLQTVHKNMTSKLLQLPDKHSVTALLNTWAQSVRQACLSAA
ncbi:mediator of RNA polymerase II transcription subunit 15-like isoform X2 [Myxocyprinus asiaticus]|uniref:mediator of RNA polymerase II transcription subunit 15-like isoform X2 n=1 Tax=Myxocyprinus asiaticus TaxID=70543 RepID=UPI002221E855|nr:mediator of RNA polymerase II transcription subunit 15-like isoform X2 [Myxocyprinus asiaticus]